MAKEKRQALPARHELKYFINAAEVQALRMRLFPVMEMDSHCKNGPYAIRSLYFDDIYDTAWYEKDSGVMNRDKYRIRIYRYSDAEIFLERKRKMGDLIQKSSVRITRRLADRLDRRESPGTAERGKSPFAGRIRTDAHAAAAAEGDCGLHAGGLRLPGGGRAHYPGHAPTLGALQRRHL